MQVKKAEDILAVPVMDIEGKGEVSPSLQPATQSSATLSPRGIAPKTPIYTPRVCENERPAPPLNICAQNITFAYDKRKIIDGISLIIPEHTTTAGRKCMLCVIYLMIHNHYYQ